MLPLRTIHHATRGLIAKQLKTSNWLTGPKFLWQKEQPDRECKVGEIKEDDPELCKAVCNTKAKGDRSLLDRRLRFSDWSRAVKAVARLKRQVKEYKGVKQRTNKSTSLEEWKEAELAIFKIVQEDARTNFIGVRREFTELIKGMDQERAKALGCEFLMNISSCKSHVRRLREANTNYKKCSYCYSQLVSTKARQRL